MSVDSAASHVGSLCVCVCVCVCVRLQTSAFVNYIIIIIIIIIIIVEAGFYPLFPDFRRGVLFGGFPGFDHLSSSNRGEPGSITGHFM